jgi:hypothetical protein
LMDLNSISTCAGQIRRNQSQFERSCLRRHATRTLVSSAIFLT